MESLITFFLSMLVSSSFVTSPEKTGISQSKCLECHGDLIENSVVHPIAEEGCELCHEATGEKHPGEEIGFNVVEPYPDLCHICHDTKNEGDYVHTPVKEGDCSGCHSPHSTNHRSLILDDFSENACNDCHYIETEDIQVVHGPVMEGNCQACHDPHYTANPMNLKKPMIDQCLTCHDKAIKKGDKEIVSLAEQIVEGNVLHGPVDNGDCASCHNPHSGEYPFLLIGEYPVLQYTEATVENFELCFMCHDSELLTQEETEYATNFRNGTKNLHYLHIRGNRGRNCHLCHNPHGAPNTHILENTVLFGRWEMPMKLELTDTGGSCATGCHKKLAYSRELE